jgi:pimeloyl-ACP methyl ester carboxylesterase
VSGSNQNVTVFGSSFQSGLTVSITFPGGGGTTLSGTQIQSVTSTSFVMVATLSATGTWSIRVNNPDGGQSNTFFFTVQSASQPPSISSVSPSSPTRSDSNQNVSVFGSNFVSGLTVTVFIPGGGTATLSGSQIQSVSSNSFTMVITLNVVGTYGIRVNNPSGAQSNTFNFSVQAANPSINSISPSSPTRSDSDQSVSVFGSNFVSGLTVTVFIPGGGTATLSGSQIQSVSSGSFTMVITLNVVGQYGIRVNNSGGAQSNTFNFTVQSATPSISSVSPSSPTRSDSNQNVSVFGSNFVSGLTVTVFIPGGGTATLSGSQIQSVTSSSFTMVITLNVVGQYGIRVNNSGGAQSSTFNFNVQSAAPSISSVSPATPTRSDSDQNVSVSGSNFVSGLTVTVFIPGGGTATLSGSQIQGVTSGSFTMVVTLNVAGQYGIRVNNPSGVQSNTLNFNVQASSPSISAVSPVTPTRSDSDQSVSVSGSNFVSGLTVTVFIPGGSTATLSGSQIQSVTSGSFTMVITLNVAGQYGIRVNNPSGAQSNTFNFNVQSVSPSISSISPSTPTRGDSDQSVSVSGSNFVSGLTVTVSIPGGGTATLSGSQIQSVSSGSFTMVITLNVVGQYGIRVNNPSGAQSNTFNFNVQSVSPSISSISPSTPTRGDSDQNVQVFGNNFVSGMTVTVFIPGGGTATLSGSQIQSVTPSSFIMVITLNVVGQYGIRVNNPGNVLSNTFNFTVQNSGASPTITSISPASPSSSANDQNVTVLGSSFQQNLTVSVNFPGGGSATLSGTQIQRVTSGSFIMRITMGAVGPWSIRVINPDGSQSALFNFTVSNGVQSPSVSSVNPTVLSSNATDQDVTVNGSNFQSNLSVAVTFPSGGGTTLTGAQIRNVTSTSFVMRITVNVAGTWKIRAINPDSGQSGDFSFTVISTGGMPTISGINPVSPTTSGADQNVTVTGTNFQAGLTVNVIFPSGDGGTLQGSGQIQSVTANSFVMRITLNASGEFGVRIVNPDGRQSGVFNFSVQASAPPPSGLPSSVVSPVIGPLRATSSNLGITDGKWEFDQHKTGFHSPTGGISLSNDTFAWDTNLYTSTSGNADAGKAVYAVADGEVVSYVGTPPGGGPGAVLIAHPNSLNPVWFSGYLHMTNVRVSLNQQVNQTTVLGEIGRIGANNDHLHFVIYSGRNTRGNLQSFNATIIERGTSTINPPTIGSITPNTVNQSSVPQLITIAGTNFQSNSIVEGRAPNGQYFTVTSETVSGDDVKILSITPTTVAAQVSFSGEGTYEFAVVNRPINPASGNSPTGSFATSSENLTNGFFAQSVSNTVRALPSGRTPVILIPGIMGSRIAKRVDNGFRNLWLGGADGQQRLINNLELKNNVEDPNAYRDISQRPVVATEILRNLSIQGVTLPKTDVYDRLISYLISKGFTEYDANDPNGVPNPNKRTIQGCDKTQVGADLFVFPYDWRNSNWTSARDLYEYVQCIKSIRGNPANFKVDVIAHSMGGLVARRYILNFPGNHYVDRMVTLGTPWLGAPKFLNTLEFGGDFWDPTSAVILPPTIKELAPYIKGAHELIPSRAYVDDLIQTWNHPLWEDGWNDFDFDVTRSTPASEYNFNRLKATMNYRYANRPGDAADSFHSQIGQDDWRGDTSGVSYYNFVGYGKNTIVSLIAKKDWLGQKYFDQVKLPDGDGTVPLVSALRNGTKDYRGPIRLEKGFPLEHGALASDPSIFPFINCVVNVPNADGCISARASIAVKESGVNADAFVGEPSYLVKVIGSHSVAISDSFGNTTNPLNTSVGEGLSTVQTDVTGDSYLSAAFPLDQGYRIVLKIPDTPVSILLTKSDGQTITNAIRYVDITLPPNVLASLEITPQGVSALTYDSNGDGTFDTTVNPTVSVTGPAAQDVEPPTIAFSETVQSNSLITITATDTGSGVKSVFYSLDGKNYQVYAGTLNVNPAQTPIVYAFADDNVGNRSGLSTFQLSPAITLQLASSSFEASERDGSATFTVTRSGNTSGPATVQYSTADGTASQKKDYLFAFGTLSFGPGETSKSFSVLLINNSYVDGDRIVTITLSNPTGASLGLVGSATLIIHDNDVALSPTNPVDDAGFFVNEHYFDFLNRQPDPSGLAFWTNEITSCGSDQQCIEAKRVNVSAAYFLSIEFQQTGYLVERIYKAAYGDGTGNSTFGGPHMLSVPIIRLTEFLPDAQAISKGVVVGQTGWEQAIDNNKVAFTSEFVQRPRFTAAYPNSLTPAQFVDALFVHAGVAPSLADRNAAVGEFGAATTTADATARGRALRRVAENATLAASEFNRAFVLMQYFGYLRRNPNDPQDSDYSGYEFWLSKLNQFNGNFQAAEMVKAFIVSAEYRQRFGP